jgi:hypothetical protein
MADSKLALTLNSSFNNLWGSICNDPCYVDGKTVCESATSDVLTSLPTLIEQKSFWVGLFTGLQEDVNETNSNCIIALNVMQSLIENSTMDFTDY